MNLIPNSKIVFAMPSALIAEALHNNGFPSGDFEDRAQFGRASWMGEMTDLLQGIVDLGFFGWKGLYSSLVPLNNPPFDVLTVNLVSVSHSVRAIGSSPDGFDALFYELREGAGLSVGLAEGVSEFVPEKGFLTVWPTSNTFSDPLPAWQTDELGFSLAEVGEGKYIGGAALEFAWAKVTLDQNRVVNISDRYYVIEWYRVQHNPNSNPETFEIILDLDTNVITVQYLVVSNAPEVLVGVENSDGSEATLYALNDPTLVANNTVASAFLLCSPRTPRPTPPGATVWGPPVNHRASRGR